MDLSIIIINWNSRVYLAACLRSIFRHAPSIQFEVIVLDSGSFDGCGEMLVRDFPEIRFIQSEENLGFARANNLAVRHARGHTFLFLNPDTEVHAGAIQKLYEVARDHPNAGAVGARLLNTDGTLQTSCVQAFPTILNQILISDFLIRLLPRFPLWGKAALFEQRTEPAKVEAVSGAAIMMRRAAFERIGGFCDEYFMYSEDIDLCYQANAANLRNCYVPTAEIMHHGGGSSARQPSRFTAMMKAESVRHYFVRNTGRTYSWLFAICIGTSAVLRVLLLQLLSVVVFGRAKAKLSATNSITKWRFVLEWALSTSLGPSYRRVLSRSSGCDPR